MGNNMLAGINRFKEKFRHLGLYLTGKGEMFRKGSKRKIWIPAICIAAAVLCGVVSAGNAKALSTNVIPSGVIANDDAVIDAVRTGLREHSAKITVRFRSETDVFAKVSEIADMWMEEAQAETEDPGEGDYIRYQNGGYYKNVSQSEVDGMYLYTVEIIPKYYIYLVQEEEARQKIAEVMESFGFDENTADYEKIKTVYDYICKNVRYDEVHKKNRFYYMRSTAYGALVNKTATCQGYCVTLYRLLREAGINARIITGESSEEEKGVLHAWNIAELDGMYYNLDATWDAGKEEYEFFLKGSASFEGHVPDEKFLSEDFMREYPVSAEDYNG